jgi:hypothetical protein
MKTTHKKNREAGFALIVTLSLMILLTVIAVGLLSLSTITLRATSQGASQAIANSNARMALMLAIGDLQKHLGPDQRISANADSFSTSSGKPNAVGVWESHGWLGDSSPAPDPSVKQDKFRTWLMSTKDPLAATDFEYGSTGAPTDSIWLSNPVSAGGNLPLNDTTMRAERIPLTIGTSRGSMAWMVTDNSSRVPLNIPGKQSREVAENIAYRTAPSAPRPDVLNAALNINDPSRLISMQTAALAASVGGGEKKEVLGRTSSVTSSSLGLLTNTALGGLKTDLTPLLESNSANLTTALGAATPYYNANDGAPQWSFLRSHYQLYKRVTNQAAGKPKFRLLSSDMSAPTAGMVTRPTKPTLLPVIAKLQIMFSLVSHHAHIGDRVNAYNTRAVPLGNNNHAIPHLVYDPVITLYNPYDVELELSQLRVRVSDPPVGFQFQKHDKQAGTNPYYRDEFGAGEYHGLARFQINNETSTTARKTFTLFLRNKTATGSPGGSLILLPGEVKVFSPWTEDTWTWGVETGSGYAGRSFFDHDSSRDMGNQDLRTGNKRGVEAVPGLNWKAGLQTDHLSYGRFAPRPQSSKYPWETSGPFGEGWLSMKVSDDVTVNCRPQRCVTGGLPDFQVDVLAGGADAVASDVLRTFQFRLGDVTTEMALNGSAPKISRRFNNGDLLQKPGDNGPAGKTPFAIFTMSAKTTIDAKDDSKSWLFNNMVTEGGLHESVKIGNAAQSYELSLREVSGTFTNFPGVEYDSGNNRGYFGAIATANKGVSVVPMYRVPLTPAASLGDWIAANLITSSQFPRVNYPLGNSFAHPLIPSASVSATSPMGGGARMLDHTYLMNSALWDAYYFSTATDYTGAAFSTTRNKTQVVKDFFTEAKPMLNSRLVPYISGSGDAAALASSYAAKAEIPFAKGFAKNAFVQGAFNVNSGSIEAWTAVLSSMREASVTGYGKQNHDIGDRTAFVRNGLPIAGTADDANPAVSAGVLGQVRWAGFRALTDGQIKNLATLIVQEIRSRGTEDKAPSLSVADFVNRRIASASSVHALKGILQTAIDKSDINQKFHEDDSKSISGSSLVANRVNGLQNTNALDGYTGDGAAPMLTQGDLLTGLAPIITVRGDTFTIRSYGEARASNGTTVLARSWCEATVQRVPEYVDQTNPPEFDVSAADGDITASGLSPANQLFGRRFVMTSFRWLNSTEI